MAESLAARAIVVPIDSQRVVTKRMWLARLVAYGLPILLVVAAYGDRNLWPVTGWRLFSGVREGTVPTWIVDLDVGEGETIPFDPERASEAQGTWRHQLDHSKDDPGRQAELCRQWLDDAREDHPSVRGLTIRRAVMTIPRGDERSEVTWSRVVQTC